MVLPDEYDLDEQLIVLNDKIKAKYEGESILEDQPDNKVIKLV